MRRPYIAANIPSKFSPTAGWKSKADPKYVVCFHDPWRKTRLSYLTAKPISAAACALIH